MIREPWPWETPQDDSPRASWGLKWYGGFAVRRVRFTTDPLPAGISETVEIDGNMYDGIDTGTEFVVRGVCLVGAVAE